MEISHCLKNIFIAQGDGSVVLRTYVCNTTEPSETTEKVPFYTGDETTETINSPNCKHYGIS